MRESKNIPHVLTLTAFSIMKFAFEAIHAVKNLLRNAIWTAVPVSFGIGLSISKTSEATFRNRKSASRPERR